MVQEFRGSKYFMVQMGQRLDWFLGSNGTLVEIQDSGLKWVKGTNGSTVQMAWEFKCFKWFNCSNVSKFQMVQGFECFKGSTRLRVQMAQGFKWF